VTDDQVDALRRELLIASSAARKLSTALAIAWAQLTETRFSGPMGGNEKAASRLTIKEKNGGPGEAPLPFPEDPFL